jgi:hypothetical protein
MARLWTPGIERCADDQPEYSVESIMCGAPGASLEEYVAACRKVKLKPCPFCGGAAKNSPHNFFAIFCTNCGVYGPMATGLVLTIEGWNRGLLESFVVPGAFGYSSAAILPK